uniref:Lon N-terminal domain-containing protein n=1 Tax=Timema monikensis TaxID=170555 RepID=A0A7R9E6N4_9NEOP|nr:unnamed protein product [Timema monikensis]
MYKYESIGPEDDGILFNCDEIAFSRDPRDMKIVAEKSVRRFSRNIAGTGKTNTTVLACGETDGTKFLSFIIFTGTLISASEKHFHLQGSFTRATRSASEKRSNSANHKLQEGLGCEEREGRRRERRGRVTCGIISKLDVAGRSNYLPLFLANLEFGARWRLSNAPSVYRVVVWSKEVGAGAACCSSSWRFDAETPPYPVYASTSDDDSDNVETQGRAVYSVEHERQFEHTFDPALPLKHSYLGNDLEELQGRTMLDDDSIQTLALLPQPGVVLVPGQTLPLSVFYPPTVSMLRQSIATDRTFGVVCVSRYLYSPRLAEVGTTAEIYEFQKEERSAGFRVKAKGRQRFKILETRRQVDGEEDKPSCTFTTKSMAIAFHRIQEGLQMLADEDPDVERSARVHKTVMEGLTC